MRKLLLLPIAFILFSSHDMFLKSRGYFLKPHKNATIDLFNGTFDQSDNVITRDRMLDVSLVGNGERTPMDTLQWSDEGNTSVLKFFTGDEGTWLAGVSTAPRNIEMTGEEFNDYLEHDGVIDMLAWRKENNAMDQAVVERYSKHVKAIFQVGDKRSNDWATEMGYPIEFVPLSNPYEAKVGDVLQFKLLRDGVLLKDQLVYASQREVGHVCEHGHHHGGDHDHDHETIQLRTDDNGVVSVKIESEGIWFLRTIHLVAVEEEGLTHESNWATITFQVGEVAEVHHHHHGPSWYIYAIAALVVIGGLVWWRSRS